MTPDAPSSLRHSWRRFLSAGLGLSLTIGAVACSAGQDGGPTSPDPVVPQPQLLVSIIVSIDSSTMTVAQTATAKASGLDQHRASMTVGPPAWTSLQPTVANVSADGVVSALSPGQATIVAAIGPIKGQTTITVKPRPPGPLPVATVDVSPIAATVEAGQTIQLDVTPRDFAGDSLTNRTVTWTTSDPAIATVSSGGLVTAFVPGNAIIEATCEGKHGAIALTVGMATDADVSVSIAQPLPLTIVGDTVKIIATVQSTAPIVRAVVVMAGQEVPMEFGKIGGGERAKGWFATLNLSILAFGPWSATVIATDERGHRGQTSVTFVRNPKVDGGSKAPAGNK